MTYQGEKIFLTKEGLENLQQELKDLREERKEKIRNPEEDQDEIAFLTQKIQDIEASLKSYELIKKPPKGEQGTIDLGATVTVEVDGHTSDLTIVGTLEANPPGGRISNESPVGQALMGCKAGDVITMSSTIPMPYKIKKIKYEL
jgi:transcription elongation factor GreA